jgi:chromosomal replication initiation ATPase DnaA
VTELVGIDGKRDLELINLLDGGDPNNKLKVVSVVGFGGLGKTTLVQAVYKKIKSAFDSSAFVPVGRSADVKKVLRDILFDLKCSNNDLEVLDERQLIDQVRTFLENKRYVYTHL